LKNIPQGIFITGTDTGVGKTVVTAALACCIKSAGLKVKAVKPFQTGTEEDEVPDIEFVYKTLSENFDINEVCPVRLKKPLSPYSAGFFENINFNISDLLGSLKKIILPGEVTLFEGAGGLLAPITKDYFMSDFASDLGVPVVIVARPGLGTLNHTLLSIEHAKNKGLKILGIVICNYPAEPDLAESLNIKTLKHLTDVEVIGIIPSIEGLDIQKGIVGKLAENSKEYFVNSLGGKLNLNNFLT
jgi:dethiobiotin synthetase